MAKSRIIRNAVFVALLAAAAFGQTPAVSTIAPKGQLRSSKATDDLTFWGYANTRIWRDVNHDGFQDFCRVIRTQQKGLALRCTLSTGNSIEQSYAGSSFETEVSQSGTLTTGHWTVMGKDDSIWFCRTISAGVRRGYLSCFPVVGSAFGKEVRSAEAVDLGTVSGRAWVDFNGDGRPDFCTLIEQRPGVGKLSCLLLTEQTFAEVPITSERMQWQPISSMRKWIVNSQGTVDFCTVAGPGNRFIDCVTSNGMAFGDTHRDLLDHRAVR